MNNSDILTYVILIIGLVMAVPMFVRIGEILSQRVRLILFPVRKVKIRRWHNEKFMGYGELDLTSQEPMIDQLDRIDAELKSDFII
ncbi:hypothetical protein [Pasteurella multocida]|uniref:hypothetical protein n=1 Tax=Pasteurella multocida TaxID=747 RepID=UPI00099A5E83|nr:hypothetical protein [Pasteurella multocida]MBE7395140.1 hypothetical protein [Pasteurella multocida]MCL7756120.1 hypothetical protein [Pasteurella multocida]MCL7761682.1 hypothetical protein [Pasteurella multocida]MCL7779850.1 hypothetical protein [Pasteurella multocida]MCL7785640.1 hypothetical protein [Pasteurella multocida]